MEVRNSNLDKVIHGDEKIGKLIQEGSKSFRMVSGIKIYQIEEKSQRDIDLNLISNRHRVSMIVKGEYKWK